MERQIVNGIEKKSKYIVINILFTLTVSISAIMFDKFNLYWAYYMGGWSETPDKHFEGFLVTVAFLVAWLLYGIVMGYMKKKSFVKFISFYWGISGLIFLTAGLMAPIGKFAILVFPVAILTLAPTYGIGYFIPNSYSHLLLILAIPLSWSAGAIGFLLGYLLRKLSVSTLSD